MKRPVIAVAASGVALCLCILDARADGLYVSLHGGVSIPKSTISDFDTPGGPLFGPGTMTTEADLGYRFGGAFGYAFSRYLSAEVELSYTHNELDTISVVSAGFPAGPSPLPARGGATTLSGMVNAYLSLPMDRWRPYVGAGAGQSYVSANGVGIAGVVGETNDNASAFSWQVMGGVGFQLSPSLELGARYRFQHIDGYSLVNNFGHVERVREREGQSVDLTLTWAFSTK